jgi:hypothetical protein
VNPSLAFWGISFLLGVLFPDGHFGEKSVAADREIIRSEDVYADECEIARTQKREKLIQVERVGCSA